jgi:hypothetical protein
MAQRPKDEARGRRLGSRAFYLNDFVSSSQDGDHPEKNLAKSGYRIDLKVGKTKKRKHKKENSGYRLDLKFAKKKRKRKKQNYG